VLDCRDETRTRPPAMRGRVKHPARGPSGKGISAGRGLRLPGQGARPQVARHCVSPMKLHSLFSVGRRHRLCLAGSNSAGGEAMTRVLGTLIAATFVAVALLAWVTVPS
jgi:hypothetical protein